MKWKPPIVKSTDSEFHERPQFIVGWLGGIALRFFYSGRDGIHYRPAAESGPGNRIDPCGLFTYDSIRNDICGFFPFPGAMLDQFDIRDTVVLDRNFRYHFHGSRGCFAIIDSVLQAVGGDLPFNDFRRRTPNHNDQNRSDQTD